MDVLDQAIAELTAPDVYERTYDPAIGRGWSCHRVTDFGWVFGFGETKEQASEDAEREARRVADDYIKAQAGKLS